LSLDALDTGIQDVNNTLSNEVPVLRNSLLVLRDTVITIKNTPTPSDLTFTGDPTEEEQNTARRQYDAQLQTIIYQINEEIAMLDRLTLQFRRSIFQAVELRNAIAAAKVRTHGPASVPYSHYIP
jgi:hypothetical protein